MRELVLGGDGLIGSTLVQELSKLGHSVTSLDLKNGCDLRQVDDQPFKESMSGYPGGCFFPDGYFAFALHAWTERHHIAVDKSGLHFECIDAILDSTDRRH